MGACDVAIEVDCDTRVEMIAPCALRLASIRAASEGSMVRTSVGRAVEKDGGTTVTLTVTTAVSLDDDWVVAGAEDCGCEAGTVGKARVSVPFEQSPPDTPVDWKSDIAADSVVHVRTYRIMSDAIQ